MFSRGGGGGGATERLLAGKLSVCKEQDCAASTSARQWPWQQRLTSEILDEHQRYLLAQRPNGIAYVGVVFLTLPPLFALPDGFGRVIELHGELGQCLLPDALMP